MLVLESQPTYFSPVEVEANFDAPQYPEREEWELTLSEMKEAILEQKFLQARLLMYSLERKILAAKMEAYNDGFKQGSLPLPF